MLSSLINPSTSYSDHVGYYPKHNVHRGHDYLGNGAVDDAFVLNHVNVSEVLVPTFRNRRSFRGCIECWYLLADVNDCGILDRVSLSNYPSYSDRRTDWDEILWHSLIFIVEIISKLN